MQIKDYWKRDALVDSSKYKDLYEDSIKNNDKFWDTHGSRVSWIKNQNIALRALSTSKNKITETRKITKKLWSGNINDIESSGITDNKINEIIKMGSKKREKLGHYQGAMFYYGGEWYWGVDRERVRDIILENPKFKQVNRFDLLNKFSPIMVGSNITLKRLSKL